MRPELVLSDRNRDRTAPDRERRLMRFKRDIHAKLVTAIDPAAVGKLSDDQLRNEVRRAAEELSRYGQELLTAAERERLVQEVMNETFGLGPLEPLMKDPGITDILINGPQSVYVEREGRLVPTEVCFEDDYHLRQVVQRIVTRVGRRIDEGSPLVDARLPDGSRLNAVMPPLAVDGTLVSIRRFPSRALRLEDLIQEGALTADMAEFLGACVRARLNVLISGGTGSGKTTLLNALSAFIPPAERVVTIEDAAELRLQGAHVARMETRPANVEGVGEVTIRDLVRNALRMRPDRIIIGECRGAEALDLLQAMNTGHEGSLATIHANDTRDALDRLEMMVAAAGLELPLWSIRRQIASSIHLIVQLARLDGGIRKVVRVAEVAGLDGQELAVRTLFEFCQTGVGEQGEAQGEFQATGLRSRFLPHLRRRGIALADHLFEGTPAK